MKSYSSDNSMQNDKRKIALIQVILFPLKYLTPFQSYGASKEDNNIILTRV